MCDVNPGMSIQTAVDLAQKGATIVVCPGIYPESVRVATDGITLQGKPGAILDGAALAGTRYGIVIANGVDTFTLDSFEVRNYANPLDSGDLSAGIAAAGSTKKVKISFDDVHDNGFAGVVSGAGTATNWKIVDSRFASNGFAHVLLQGGSNVDVLRNAMTGISRVPVVIAGTVDSQVGYNVINGTGLAAIAVSPGLGDASRSADAKVHHNTVRGSWTHGVWLADAARSNVSSNDVAAQSALTIAGDPKEVKVQGAMRVGLERSRVSDVVDAFRRGPATLHASAEVVVPYATCSELGCAFRAFASWLPDVLPVARAQVVAPAPPPVVLTCGGPAACARSFVTGAYDLAAGQILNLDASPADSADRARLAGCEGARDSCLTRAFFAAGDVATPRAWNVTVGPGRELRFVDAGVRRAGGSTAHHVLDAPLDATYETLLLCRLYVNGAATSCASLPRQLDFGLDETWAATDLARHLSTWRLKLPDDQVHATFDRIHGPDATLFHATTVVYDAQSAPLVPASTPPADPARVAYTGRASLQCRMLPTNDPANWTAGAVTCPSAPLVSQPLPAGYAWCSGDAPAAREDAHASQASEIAAGYWAWSVTCSDLPPTMETTWDRLLSPGDRSDLAAAQAAGAQAAAMDVLARAFGRHLAKRLDGAGLPNVAPDATAANASRFTVGPLEWDSGARANVRVAGIDAVDRLRGLVPLAIPALAPTSTAHVRVRTSYLAANGADVGDTLDFLVRGSDTAFPLPPVLVSSTGQIFGSVHAADRNDVGAIHEIPLVNVTQGGVPIASGLFDAGFVTSRADPMQACAVDLATMRADGARSNLMGVDRLAVVDAAQGAAPPCVGLDALSAIDLRSFGHLLTTLEIREGDVAAPSAVFRIARDPLALANATASLATSLTLAGAYGTAPGADTGASDGTLRVVLTIPRLPRDAQAIMIGQIVERVGPKVNVVAIEVPDLPAPESLVGAIERVADRLGVIVLVAAGGLPPAGAALAPQDKLMTITGLATHPRVLTIGSGSVAGGVDAWSRLGPTPKLLPKPDFVAPSLGLSPVASVANALPFVEAIALQGVRNVDLVRAVLASFATPIRGENGAPATFYEQGYGALDLGRVLGLDSTGALLQLVADRSNRSVDAVTRDAANALGVADDVVRGAPPGALVGVVTDPAPLLRAAVTATLVNLTLDSPAFPANLEVDFGVVNHDLAGEADFTPLDYDAVLNATMTRLRALLQGTGVTGTHLDEITASLQGIVDVSVRQGQDVTLNATHYAFFDTLSGDLLYTMYANLAEQAYDDAPALQTPDVRGALDAAEGALGRWKLQPHYLTEERSGSVTLDAKTGLACANVPLDGVQALTDATLNVLHREAAGFGLGPAGATMAAFGNALPRSFSDLLSEDNAAFVRSEATQLLCAEEAKAILRTLLNDTLEMEVLARAPPGALNETEAWQGTFDKTLLGGQLNATLSAVGVTPASVARDASTIVLGQTATILGRSLAKIDSTLALVGVPNVTARDVTGPRSLRTLPERTSDLAKNPLGLYVGLARMTSRNVTVRDPLTGHVLAERNVTIPLPSFLWSNPTLQATLAYRDGAPLEKTELILHDQKARVFSKIASDLTVQRDGLTIPLVSDHVKRVRDQRDGALDQLALVRQALADAGVTPLPEPFGSSANATLRGFEQALQDRADSLNVSLASAHVADDVGVGGLLAPMVETTVLSLVSRLDHQLVLTDDAGKATVPNLFPGSYTKFFPYPYEMLTQLDRDYAPNAPGFDGLAGPMDDTALEINKLARATTDRLGQLDPPAPQTAGDTLGPDGDCVAPCTGAYPFFEIDGGDTDPFHQFQLRVQGPDVFGALCAMLDSMDQRTSTRVTMPGCRALALDPSVELPIGKLQEVLRCAEGFGPGTLGADDAAACASVATQLAADREACAVSKDRAACVDADARQRVADAIRRLSDMLGSTRLGRDVTIAPPHSPIRAILDAPADAGFTVDGLLPAARAANPGVDDARLSAAIQAALASLRGALDPLRPNLTITPPAATSAATFTESEGVLGHVTDKITGTDWTHVDAGIVPRFAGTNAELAQALADVAALVVNASDRAAVESFLADVRANDALAPFNAGLANAASVRAAGLLRGWTPNGSATPDGLRLPGASQVETTTKDQACAAESAATGLPTAYFACQDLQVVKNAADLRGPGGIDKVAFVNGLLERIHEAQREGRVAGYRELLENATAWSASAPGQNWSRTTDAIRMRANVGVASAAPAVGALLYSTPIPSQEYLVYRFDAQILAQNTGALLITTGNPTWARTITELVNTLNVTALVDPAAALNATPRDYVGALDPANVSERDVERIGLQALGSAGIPLRIMDNVTRIATGAKGAAVADPLFRIEPIGFPVALDDHASVGTAPAKTCLVCKSGFVAARPDGYYDYSREYELNTIGTPVDALYVILVYFPSTTRSDDLSQELLVRNASVQATTYLGIDASPGKTSWDVPLRYAPRVEDEKLLVAVPPQRASDLDVTLRRPDAAPLAYVPTSADVIQAASPRWSESFCSKTVAPGYDPGVGTRARGVGSARFLFAAESDKCITDRIDALEPHVVTSRFVNMTNWTTSVPGKKITDALGYTFNVDGLAREEMTHADKMRLGSICNLLCEPVGAVADAIRAPPLGSSTDAAVAAANAQLDAARSAALGVAGAMDPVLRTIIDVPIPFTQPSFMPNAQRGADGQARSGLAHHVYFVLNETIMRSLTLRGNDTSSAYDPAWRLVVRENASSTAPPVAPAARAIVGQSIPNHARDPDYRALVAEHAFSASVEQPDGAVGQDVDQRASVFLANGISGTGVAILVAQPTTARAGDDSKYALEGLHSTSGSAVAITVYALGGVRTSDALCATVPGYDVVRPYFRCTGVSHTTAFAGVAGSAQDNGCFSTALQLLSDARDDALVATLAADDGAGLASAEARLLFERAFATGGAGAPGAQPAQRIAEAATSQAALTKDAIALTSCLSAAGVPYAGSDAASTLGDAMSEATRGSVVNATRGARLSVGLVDAELARSGEPTRLMTPTLALSGGATSVNGFVSRADVVGVDALLDEWSTHATSAFVNVTATPRGGSPTTTTLAMLPKPSQLTALPALSERLSGAAAVWDEGRRVAWVFQGQNVSRYDPATGRLTRMNAKLDAPRDGLAAAWASPYAYVVGGGSANVLRYDPRNDTIAIVASLPSFARSLGGAFADGARVYLVGGKVGASTYANLTSVYSIANGTAYNLAGGSPPRHEFGLAYDGAYAWLLGGRNVNEPRGEIFRLTPGTGEVVQMGAKLPGLHVRESGVFDGRYVDLVGASVAPDRVVRYDPLTDTAIDLPAAALPTGVGSIAAFSDGSGRAWLLGGSDLAEWKTTAYLLDPVVPIVPNVPATHAIRVATGGSYQVTFDARDEYGGAFHAALSFVSDPVKPTIDTALAPLTWTKGPLRLDWTARDDVSGVASVTIRQRPLGSNAAWAPWPSTSDPAVGGSGPYAFTRTLATGLDTEVSVTVTDRAGNANSTAYVVRFDVLPPDLTGVFDEAVNGWIPNATLLTTARASDAGSGLRDVSVWLANRTSERLLYANASLRGASATPLIKNATLSWHTTSADNAYWIKAYANDTVGNAATFLGTVANGGYGADLIAPTLASVRPNLTTQGVVRGIALSPSVVGPAARFPADLMIVNVTSVATGAVVFRANVSGANGTYPTYWAAPAGADGAYDVTYDAISAQAHRKMTARLNVRAAPGDLADYETYGQLNGTGAADVFTVRPLQSGCVATAILYSLDGTNVALDFRPATGPDTLPYAQHAVTNGSVSVPLQMGPTDAALKVSHTGATSTPYAIILDVVCNGASNRPPAPTQPPPQYATDTPAADGRR